MPWSTTRETLVRRYCPAVAEDTTNWSDTELQYRWDDAFYWLKSRLCPPFAVADVDLLNGADTHTEISDRLIARVAAHQIYTDLSGGDDQTEFNARETYIEQWIERIENGTGHLFDSSGNPLERESLIYHNLENVAQEFTRTRRDSATGTVIDGQIGTLDQH